MGVIEYTNVLMFQFTFYYFQEGAENNNKHLPALVVPEKQCVQRSSHLSSESQIRKLGVKFNDF